MKIKLFIFTLIILFVSSCSESFLEQEDPTQITTDDFWETEDDIISGLASIYNAITDDYEGHYGTVNWELIEGKTENFTIRNDVRARYTISIYQNTSSNESAASLYKGAYVGIFRANQVIQYGENIDISDDVKNPLIAEAKFLRGLNYFFLVTDFGQVPITTAVAETSDDYYVAKSTKEKVWAQVISDLKEGEKYLPDVWNSDNKGRATRGAALAYLGRAYLYQKDYDNTISMLKEIVDNKNTFGYGLQKNFAELFDGEHENGKEGIFEIEYSNVGGTSIWADEAINQPQTTFIAEECAPGEVGGWYEIQPTSILLDAFLKEKTADGNYDPRALATLAWNYEGCKHYQVDFSSKWGSNEIWLKKNQNWWNANETDNEYKSELNEYGMRYADVLLMLAEAYTMKGNIADAAPLVHQIRERANLTDKLTAMKAYSEDEMMKEIRHQRNLEFAREGLHWYDLKRWGLLEETLSAAQQPGYQNYTSKFEYFPIPENELNNNPNMNQNDPW